MHGFLNSRVSSTALSRFIWLLPALFSLLAIAAPKAEPPALSLAKVYDGQLQLEGYWVSEKLDGVRAYWNGSQLISRQGYVFNPPAWFTDGFPTTPLDGELWMGRGTFDRLSGIVRRQTPNHNQWRQLRYMVFDLPIREMDFDQRLARLKVVVKDSPSPYLHLVEQFKVADQAALMRRLEQVVRQGGEGLMLHRGASFYRAYRSDDLLKLKTWDDAEAVVIAHLPGKGKYRGMMGSLLVQTRDQRRFKIGTGFTDSDRANPPPVGCTITYKFFGKTRNNLPRFASFLRVRDPDI